MRSWWLFLLAVWFVAQFPDVMEHAELECMNNTIENDVFGFPKVKWLQYTGEVGKCTSH